MFEAEEGPGSDLPESMRRLRSMIILTVWLCLFPVLIMLSSPALATDLVPLHLVQRPGKASSPQVGAAMTVLATLDHAQVLPPEGTKAADRIIQSVIQLQSLFTTSTDPAVQAFLRRAIASRDEEQAAQVLAHFRSNGWTPEVLDALARATQAAQAEDLQALAPGLRSVNLSVEDFRQFMQLIVDGTQALTSAGQSFHEVFASHRKTMPGARSQ